MFKIISKIINHPFRILLKLKFLKKKNLKSRFSIIYNNNYWDNKESISGPGSTIKNTKNLRKRLNQIIKKYNIKTIFDAPCGDCNWIKFVISKNNVKYLGADIVEECIKQNKLNFNNIKYKFKQLDITKDILPRADLFICRDFMFHLSYEDNFRFLKNIQKIDSRYILISSHSLSKESYIYNKDIESGDFRKINLFTKPFNFKKKYEMVIKDDCDGVEKYLILFKKEEFKKFSNYMKI